MPLINDLRCQQHQTHGSPWCYVGKARLEKAMAKFADRIDFRVRW